MDELRLIETADELDELGPAWEALAADGGSPMQRHAWARAFAAAFGIEYELKVLVLGSGTDIAAVAPLATRRDGITRLELVAGEAISEPGDFVYRDPKRSTGSRRASPTWACRCCSGGWRRSRRPARRSDARSGAGRSSTAGRPPRTRGSRSTRGGRTPSRSSTRIAARTSAAPGGARRRTARSPSRCSPPQGGARAAPRGGLPGRGRRLEGP